MCESMPKYKGLKNAIHSQMYLPGNLACGVSTLYLVKSLNIFCEVFHSELSILHYTRNRKLADEKPSS